MPSEASQYTSSKNKKGWVALVGRPGPLAFQHGLRWLG